MAMPEELVLVRHGHSEGNLVVDRSKQGDDSFYTPDFRERPGHRWRLTEEGQKQAEIAGRWVLENISEEFDRYYVSPYVRAKETAGLLGLPDAEWRVDPRLRERDWGDIGSLPRSEFKEQYPQNAFLKEVDSLYWRPPGGESIQDVRMRVRNMFDTLHRETAGQKVIIVTHGEFMWATRAELEYMSDEDWVEADNNKDNKIHNAQVIHYSKNGPGSEPAKYLSWTRSVCPWLKSIDVDWLPIERHRFTNEQLREQVCEVEPTVNIPVDKIV
jgi:broad specificity phosphatase PhoE